MFLHTDERALFKRRLPNDGKSKMSIGITVLDRVLRQLGTDLKAYLMKC